MQNEPVTINKKTGPDAVNLKFSVAYETESRYLNDTSMSTEPVKHYDLGVAWTWEYDADFIRLIEASACGKNLTLLQVTKENVQSVTDFYFQGKITFGCYFDRASDENENFLSLAREILRRWKSEKSGRPINPSDKTMHAADKANMHLEFLSHGIHVPYTIIISPFNHQKEIELSLSELALLGRPFIIKPANTTGGGIGVVMGAETLKEVIDARQMNKNDKYLLQETIVPLECGGKRAWFRVFFAFGEIIPCWWDDRTHIYTALTAEDECLFSLAPLRSITQTIQSVCGLDFFSTEIAFMKNSRVVAVDYVNDMCDMRPQSKFTDGVPDDIVEKIVQKMTETIRFRVVEEQR
jgi:hypothetical protein